MKEQRKKEPILKESANEHRNKRISLRFGDFDIIFVVIVVIANLSLASKTFACDTKRHWPVTQPLPDITLRLKKFKVINSFIFHFGLSAE